jgi:hypothetical protein
LPKKLSRVKNDTAAGPDGIRKNNVTAREIIRLLFNVILVVGEQPQNWGINRTTLTAKDDKGPNKVENYRPITIGSILSRLFCGILHDSIKTRVTFTPRQKGFMDEPGCFNSIHILNEIIKHAKSRSSIAAVFLDVSKAFDTIPDDAIPDALRRKGLPEPLVRLVGNSYRNMHTVIKHGTNAIPIRIQGGLNKETPCHRLSLTPSSNHF